MYAVIETGGKQYRVEVGTELEVELLDVEAGQSITLDRVLLVADGAESAIGTPIVVGAAVDAEVVGATRGDKVIAFKYRPKARRRVKKGHRQDLTVLRIADIRFDGRSAAEAAKAAPSKADERQRLQEAAARQAAEDAALAARLKVAVPEAEAPATPRRTRAKAAAAKPAAEPVTEAATAEPAEEPVAEAAVAEPVAKSAATIEAERAEADAAAEAANAVDAAEPVVAADTEAPGTEDASAGDETTDAAPRKRTRAKKDE